MKQIFSWTIGSFFRTFGRIIAYLVIGGVIAYLLGNSNIRISELFLDKVSAETFQSGYGVVVQYQDAGHTTAYPYDDIYYYKNVNSATSNGASPNLTNFYNSMDVSDIRGGRFEAPFLITWPIVSTTSTSTIYGQDYCDRWNWRSIDSYNNVISWGCDRVSSSQDSTINDREYITPIVNLAVYVVYTDGNITYCTISNERNTISCPVPNKSTTTTISYITVSSYVRFTGSNAQTYKVGITNYFNKYSSDANMIIENQNQNIQSVIQNQQQQHNEIMDTNMTETNETASSFFDSFSDVDHGGLSTIVTAPLVMVNKMLDGVCVQPSATWKGATISLPCGDMFWNRQGASDLKNLLNIFYGGFICYYAIRKLFLMLEELKDPTQDRIEVTDL